jgi:ABC-type sugar transport system substrate-binding protein
MSAASNVVRRPRATVAGCAVIVAMGIGMSGCGSDDSAESNGSAASGGSTSAGVSSPGVAAAERAIADLYRQPTSVGTPAPTKLPRYDKNAKLVFFRCTQPVCQPYYAGAKAAADTLGLKLTVVNLPPDPKGTSIAWDQAVSENPTAVLLTGGNLNLASKQVKALAAKNVPLISSGTPGPEVTTNVQPPAAFARLGVLEADYVTSESDGKANVLYVEMPQVPLLTAVSQGFKQEIAKNCPDCSVDSISVKVEDIGRTIPGQIVSHLQSHPDVDWIILPVGDSVAGVPEALQGAGIDGVKIVSGGGSKANWSYIREGKAQVMDLAQDNTLLGWWMMDRAVRAIAGEADETAPNVPVQILRKDNIDFDINKGYTAVPNFERQFTAAWGVG